jgi:hypothetical protein
LPHGHGTFFISFADETPRTVISAGDKLVGPKTQALNRVLFHATLDGDPIDGTVEFATVSRGAQLRGADGGYCVGLVSSANEMKKVPCP